MGLAEPRGTKTNTSEELLFWSKRAGGANGLSGKDHKLETEHDRAW